MRLSRKHPIGAALAVLAIFGVAGAQTEAGPPAAPPPPAADVTTPREVELTPEQRLAEGRQYLPRMEQAAGQVRRMLEQARAARDVVKVLCLNDKLNQIDVANRSARDRLVQLETTVSRKDADRSRHEFTVLQVLRDRVNALIAEANQCIGEETGFIGDSVISMEVDPTIPDADPDRLGYDPGLILDSPIVTSPIQ